MTFPRTTLMVAMATVGLLSVIPAAAQTAPAKPPAAKPTTPATPKASGPSTIAPLVNKPGQAWEEKYMEVPFIGKTAVYVPKQPVTHVVLFLSGDGGWNLGVVDMGRRMAGRAVVVGVSYPALRRAQSGTTKCWLPAGDLEAIAHSVEKQLNLPEYYPPMLLGYSSGATLVYAAFAGAPPTTFAGGMSLGFCPDLPSNHPVCDNGDWKPTFDAKKSTAWMPRTPALPHDWYVLLGVQDQVCLPPDVQKFLDGIVNVHFISIDGTGHGFSHENHWGQPFDDSFAKLLAADKPAERVHPAMASVADLARDLDALHLPLHYEWADDSRAAAIFMSGDGGWAAIDQALAAYLASKGVSVIGVSTLQYFWSKKTPEQTGADLKRIADVLTRANLPFFVGGYSFGADVTPFALGTWAEADRRRVKGALLVAASETASFEVSPLDWVLPAKTTPLVVAKSVRALNVPTLCVTGEQTAPGDTPCDDLAGAAEAVRLPGTHHFNGKYDDVGKVVVAFIDKTVGEAPPLSVLQRRAGSRVGALPGVGPGRPLPLFWIAATLVIGIAAGWTVRRLLKHAA